MYIYERRVIKAGIATKISIIKEHDFVTFLSLWKQWEGNFVKLVKWKIDIFSGKQSKTKLHILFSCWNDQCNNQYIPKYSLVIWTCDFFAIPLANCKDNDILSFKP